MEQKALYSDILDLKFFSLPNAFHPPALRAATLGSWRMLTLGPEYEDTWWVPSPDKSGHTGQQVEEEEPEPAGETDSGAVDTEESAWKACDSSSFQKYDEALRLDRLSSAERTDGMRQMVKKHEILNNTIWPSRWYIHRRTLPNLTNGLAFNFHLETNEACTRRGKNSTIQLLN